MQAAEERVEREAIAWRLRVPTLDQGGWSDFTAWLEADPAHLPAYEQVVQAEDDADAVLRGDAGGDWLAPQPDENGKPVLGRSNRRAWITAAAASVATIGGLWALHRGQEPPTWQSISTGPGETRAVRLADGSIVNLNRDSRMTIMGDNARHVRLDRGEASFRVVHHADRPFEVAVGATILRDVGTVFNVSRRPHGLEVAVAEGSIDYEPDGRNVLLTAGQAARTGARPGALEVYDVDRAAVGSWTAGKLSFHGAPLAWVAIDVGRALSKHVTVDPDLAGRRFSGTIVVTRQSNLMRSRLEGLLDVAIVSMPGGWQLKPLTRATR